MRCESRGSTTNGSAPSSRVPCEAAVPSFYWDRCTVHGSRASFRDWASEQASVPHAVAEAALAHQVGSAVERSYARSDLFF